MFERYEDEDPLEGLDDIQSDLDGASGGTDDGDEDDPLSAQVSELKRMLTAPVVDEDAERERFRRQVESVISQEPEPEPLTDMELLAQGLAARPDIVAELEAIRDRNTRQEDADAAALSEPEGADPYAGLTSAQFLAFTSTVTGQRRREDAPDGFTRSDWLAFLKTQGV